MSFDIRRETEQRLQKGPMRVTVRRMFTGGQKPNGWFGCFASISGHMHDQFQLTGVCKDTVRVGSVLDVEGAWTNKRGYEQVVCSRVELVTATASGIINYLSGRRFPGVGRSLAQKLYDTYGDGVFDVIMKHWDEVQNKLGLSDDMISVLYNGVQQRSLENFLQQTLPTLSENNVLRIKREYGVNALDAIQKNPYGLLDIGIPFKIVDELAMTVLQLSPSSDVRVEHGTAYVLRDMLHGDVYLNLSDTNAFKQLYDKVTVLLGMSWDVHAYANALRRICVDVKSILSLESENGEMHLYLRELYRNELSIAVFARKSGLTGYSSVGHIISDYAKTYGLKLENEQFNAIKIAVENEFSCVTGGPGRGKTFVVDGIVHTFKACSFGDIVLLAPTGKAVKRLRQSVKNVSVYTIAMYLRLVKVSPSIFDLVRHYVVDEASMVSTNDMGSLMGTLMNLYQGKKVTLTLVGDADQLPPVDFGSPFHDILASGVVPVAKLTVNHRARARSIVDNADKIHAGDTKLKPAMTPDGDFEYLIMPMKADDDTMKQYVLNFYKSALQTRDFRDIAVICPTNKGEVGVKSLNIMLQKALNPARKAVIVQNNMTNHSKSKYLCNTRGAAVPGMFYRESGDNWTNIRVGDRVMETKNHPEIDYFMVDEDCVHNPNATPTFDLTQFEIQRGSGIFNGDCGTVLNYIAACGDAPLTITIGMDDGRIFLIEQDLFDEIVLAYAMTVHKSQGCEYDTVLYVSPHRLMTFSEGFACRNLAYTALTRAKLSVQIIGSKEALDKCIVTPAPKRQSLLQDRLRGVVI